jgi:hypothetical protein
VIEDGFMDMERPRRSIHKLEELIDDRPAYDLGATIQSVID